ncbi:MAG TPA: hypothetical protein VN541_11355 [Tepidisphaeraceae bacterium]|nr:hypothetical protein [Tepidisphaeraceae bacterium]
MTRLFSMAALLSLLIFCCSAWVCGITVFSHDLSGAFHLTGHLWEIGCRGGVLLIDNVPQREFEVARIAALNRESRRQWEAQHDALRGSMERAPFGPEYTAARIRLDAWERSHGIRWAGGVAEVPATPAAEYHIDLIWIVLLALMLPLAWMSSRSQRMSTSAGGRMVLVGRIGVIVLIILSVTVGAQSFRNPIAFYIFHRESSYLIWIARGKVSVGRPRESDPGKLASISRIAAHFRNGDLIWTLFPEIRYPVSRVPAGRPLPRGPLISCEIRPDVDYAHLDESPDTTELIGAGLRALHECPECGAIALDATSRETGVSP